MQGPCPGVRVNGARLYHRKDDAPLTAVLLVVALSTSLALIQPGPSQSPFSSSKYTDLSLGCRLPLAREPQRKLQCASRVPKWLWMGLLEEMWIGKATLLRAQLQERMRYWKLQEGPSLSLRGKELGHILLRS